MALLACVAGLVGCDHVSKLAAEAALRDRAPLPIVRGALDLSYTQNRDVAFDALSRLSVHVPPFVLTAFGFVVLAVVVAVWARRRRATPLEHAGFALITAGAIGNGLDRWTRGYVVDFIHVHFWPVFNVADVLIVAGIALLALLALSRGRGAGGATSARSAT